MRFQWTGITEEEFINLFPVTTNPQLASLSGLKVNTVATRAHALGLRKSPEHIMAMREQARETTRAAWARGACKAAQASPETRARQSAAHRGIPLSEQHKQRISESHKASPNVRRGANHPNWNGGPGEERGQTPESRAWRAAVLKRDDWTCQDCHVRFGKRSRGKLHAHHLKDWVRYPDLRLDLCNGVTLCHPCHWRRHGYQARGPEMKLCDCGCGREMVAYDNQRRLRHYLKNHSPKHRAAFSRNSKGRIVSAETRAKLSAAHKGKKASPESRAKLSVARKGKPHTPAHNAAIANALRDRPADQKAATAQRISVARKKALAEGRSSMPSRWANRPTDLAPQ